jgi:hypothetical protein
MWHICSHHGPITCWISFEEWDGSWDGLIVLSDYSYVVLPWHRHDGLQIEVERQRIRAQILAPEVMRLGVENDRLKQENDRLKRELERALCPIHAREVVHG